MPTCIAAYSCHSQSFWLVADTFLRGQALICVIVTTLYLTKHLHLCTLNTHHARKPHQLKLRFSFPIQPLLPHRAYPVRHNITSLAFTGIFYNILFKIMSCFALHPMVNKLTKPYSAAQQCGKLHL